MPSPDGTGCPEKLWLPHPWQIPTTQGMVTQLLELDLQYFDLSINIITQFKMYSQSYRFVVFVFLGSGTVKIKYILRKLQNNCLY